MNIISITISVIALLISIFTFWLTKIRKGQIRMTKPTIIFFGPDGIGANHKKIFIRTLLYCTADRGQYIQNMFIRLIRGETIQNFNIWVYGNKELVRGSGLFIDKAGIAHNHHFLMPKDGTNYDFVSGEYILQVYIETINNPPIQIYEQNLQISESHSNDMISRKAGIYFDWAPNTQTYYAHSDSGNDDNNILFQFKNLGNGDRLA